MAEKKAKVASKATIHDFDVIIEPVITEKNYVPHAGTK